MFLADLIRGDGILYPLGAHARARVCVYVCVRVCVRVCVFCGFHSHRIVVFERSNAKHSRPREEWEHLDVDAEHFGQFARVAHGYVRL